MLYINFAHIQEWLKLQINLSIPSVGNAGNCWNSHKLRIGGQIRIPTLESYLVFTKAGCSTCTLGKCSIVISKCVHQKTWPRIFIVALFVIALSESIQVATTEYHRLSSLKQRIPISHSSGGWEVQDQSFGRVGVL